MRRAGVFCHCRSTFERGKEDATRGGFVSFSRSRGKKNLKQKKRSLIDKKNARRYDDCLSYAIVSSKKALVDAGIGIGSEPFEKLDKTRCGVMVGSGMGGLTVFQDGVKNLVEKGFKKITPFFIPYAITNMGGALVGIETGFMGPNYSISTACATVGTFRFFLLFFPFFFQKERMDKKKLTSLFFAFFCPLSRKTLQANYAFVSAANHIRAGDADLMVVGGSEAPIIPVGLGGFVACRALSSRCDEPQRASRPWDQGRDGFVMGEGAGVLVFESLKHAQERGANILCEYLGGKFFLLRFFLRERGRESQVEVNREEKTKTQTFFELKKKENRRHHLRRLPHDRPARRRPRRLDLHRARAQGRAHREGAGQLHQRARDVDACRRRRRGESGAQGVHGHERHRDERDQVDDRALSWCRRRDGGRGDDPGDQDGMGEDSFTLFLLHFFGVEKKKFRKKHLNTQPFFFSSFISSFFFPPLLSLF